MARMVRLSSFVHVLLSGPLLTSRSMPRGM
jgi:hypothetical protein